MRHQAQFEMEIPIDNNKVIPNQSDILSGSNMEVKNSVKMLLKIPKELFEDFEPFLDYQQILDKGIFLCSRASSRHHGQSWTDKFAWSDLLYIAQLRHQPFLDYQQILDLTTNRV